jgi:hypothetical protein
MTIITLAAWIFVIWVGLQVLALLIAALDR